MGSATWRLRCPCAIWRLGCLSQSGFLSRPKRQVTLMSTPRIGAAQAPGGAQVFPSVMWRWGCHSQSGILPRPKAGAAIANRAFCQDPSVRWCGGLPQVIEPPKR
uniref:Uncharacterized protein n=1 Tax=Populus trichocarpa TaxID=3694 RepID=A0A2K2A006_POPTR